ncbi:MAG: hypothetical protein KDA65_15865, partial [Planctomycetaceae bacterium]|nr:hypothetical protein [Planctomycetaceae bacterium]
MNTRYHFITLILFLALSNNASAEFRIWTSVDGTQQINAEFVRTKGSLVELKLENGSTTTIPLKRFSREDRVYIRDAQKKENGAELKPGEETNETNSADTSVAQSDQSQEGTASRSELARLASDELAETSMKLAQQSGMSTQHGLPVIFLDHFVDLENLPVRERTNRYKTAEQSFETQQRDFGKFLERVAIGLDETCLDEYLPTFITYHFPKEVATKLVDSKFQTGGAVGIWKGRNEFERRASKEQFEKEHRKELDNLAVKTPFRICFISEASLSSYDFTRKGLVVGAKNKGGEARVPGYTWKEAIPYLPSAGYYRKKLNIANMPVFGSAFWPVSPEVVAKLPSRSRKNPIGSERITRWAYVATVVSFHSPRLLTRSEREMPTLVGEVESVGLYAEPTLKTHLYDFDLKAYPRPVLAGGAPSSDETSVIPPPFDEFALAGLLVGNDDLQLHEQVWRDLWNHTAMVDQKRYGAIEDQIKKRYDQINGHAVQVNSENRSEREEEYANNLRHEIDEKTAEIDRELHPDRQPFFPPFVSETGGRSWEVDQDILNPERTEAMTSWLAERGDRLKQQFRLTLELTLNPKTEEPTVSSLSMSPEMIQRLKEEDLSPDEIIALDENLQFDQIGELEPEGTRTGLFRTPGSQYRPYQFLLNTGTSAEVLARQLPSEVIKSALSQKPGESRLAVFLDVQIKEMKFLDGPSGFGTEPHRPVVLFEAIPTRLSAGEYNQPPLFESELSTKGLQKAAANKPVKPIPNNADDDRPALPMTPQNLMPLMIKANPELLKDAEFVDQLMVMRWRFENVGMFDVTPDGVHFFDKGSNAVPDTSRRSERADEFKAWLKKWADAIPDQFVWHL